MRNKRVRIAAVVLAIVVMPVAMYFLLQFAIETFVSDAATRLAYQIRDEAAALRRSGETIRTFEHKPRAWPQGLSDAYRIQIIETKTDPYPGHRSIGVARNLTEQPFYWTSYQLNYVDVPNDVAVSHQKGEPTIVTLELKDGKVLLTDLK